MTDSTALPFMRKFQPMRHAAHLSGGEFRCPRFNFPADALQRILPLFPGESASPDNHHVPSRLAPRLLVADVALDVLRPFLHPELDVGFRHGGILASVPVPETAVHVDYRPGPGNHDIGLPLEPPIAHPVPPTAREQAFAHEQFRQGVLASDLHHQPATLLFCYAIHALSFPETGDSPCPALYQTDASGTPYPQKFRRLRGSGRSLNH